MWAAAVAVAHGVFYVVTGLWPVLSMRSFEAVTGPKREDWLVKTFGVLLAVIGVIIGQAGLRREVNRETALLGLGSAGTLAAADVIYVARGRLHWVYLLDAAAEVGLALGWAAAWWGRRAAGKHENRGSAAADRNG